MSAISTRDLNDIQLFVGQTMDELGILGLELGVDDDLRTWKAHLNNAPGTIGVSKTLDPALNNVSAGSAFWLFLKDQNGEIVACQADRLIITEDLVGDYVATHRLFGDLRPVLHHYTVQLGHRYPLISGRVNFGGGTWVHPDWRGKSLGGVMSRLGRAIALRHFLVDYFITFMESGRKFGVECGFRNKCQIIHGRYPGRDSNQDVDLLWECRREILEEIRSNIGHASTAVAA